ncbi:hypothetical protein KCU98_g785, partial [Aureobasidium melanogenum]
KNKPSSMKVSLRFVIESPVGQEADRETSREVQPDGPAQQPWEQATQGRPSNHYTSPTTSSILLSPIFAAFTALSDPYPNTWILGRFFDPASAMHSIKHEARDVAWGRADRKLNSKPSTRRSQHHVGQSELEQNKLQRRHTADQSLSDSSIRRKDAYNLDCADFACPHQANKEPPGSSTSFDTPSSNRTPVSVLLVCVPVGFALRYTHANGYAVFIVNFLTIIPLAVMLSFATGELALYTGETLGGLLNASFGNATALIVSIIALAQHKIFNFQTSLIGTMLSNLLLVPGMCSFFASSMLAVSIGSLIIPAAVQSFGNNPAGGARISAGPAAPLGGQVNQFNFVYEEDEKGESSVPSVISALTILTIAIVFVAVTSEFVVGSIEYIVEHGRISVGFIGLMRVPIVGCATGKLDHALMRGYEEANLIYGTCNGGHYRDQGQDGSCNWRRHWLNSSAGIPMYHYHLVAPA